ncbi:MAG: hypothetical protein F6J93_03780 [Oscillatoria sp. SIO1A7]|nr:hypothetical protein [Oscillatoria sp. SIO1A7]
MGTPVFQKKDKAVEERVAAMPNIEEVLARHLSGTNNNGTFEMQNLI